MDFTFCHDRCSWWLSVRCNAVVRVFWVVANVGMCYTVGRVIVRLFWVNVITLLCSRGISSEEAREVVPPQNIG